VTKTEAQAIDDIISAEGTKRIPRDTAFEAFNTLDWETAKKKTEKLYPKDTDE